MSDLYDVLKASYGDKQAMDKIKSQGYSLDSMLSNNNNKVFVNSKDNKLLFTVKGTNPYSLQDIGTDAYLAVGQLDKTNRYKESEKILKEAKDKYQGYSTTLAAHSLGGSIISKLGKKDKVYAYNEGISPFQKTRSNMGQQNHIRSELDVVSSLGANSKNIKTIQNVYNPTGILPLDILKSHNLESLKKANIRI